MLTPDGKFERHDVPIQRVSTFPRLPYNASKASIPGIDEVIIEMLTADI